MVESTTANGHGFTAVSRQFGDGTRVTTNTGVDEAWKNENRSKYKEEIKAIHLVQMCMFRFIKWYV